MAVSTKIIRRRIKSITNTKKITKAMEMVAASKMRKAQLATLRTRDYANRAWSLISDLSGKTDSNHWVTMDGPENFGGSNAGNNFSFKYRPTAPPMICYRGYALISGIGIGKNR